MEDATQKAAFNCRRTEGEQVVRPSTATAIRERTALSTILSPLRRLFHLAREFLDALTHDLAGFELYRCPGRDDETAARLIGISADPRFGEARLKDAKIA